MSTSDDGIHTSTPTAPSVDDVGFDPPWRSAYGAIEDLATAECWRLIEDRSFGRLAVQALDGIPDVFPVNYTVHDGSIYIRSAPGSKLTAIAVNPGVALEIDGEDGGFHWSVVLRGTARELVIDEEIRESGVRALISSSPTAKHHFIGLTPSSVSGRTFATRPGSGPASAGAAAAAASGPEPTRRHERTRDQPDPDSLPLL